MDQAHGRQRRHDRSTDEFKIFTNINSTIVDPKNFDEKSFVDFKGPVCIIPPNSFALASTVEFFRIPRNVLVACLGKSTYARCGIIVNVTPLEPEWEGHVTLEFSNTTPLPAKIYANEGVAQMLFFESDEVCETSYRDICCDDVPTSDRLLALQRFDPHGEFQFAVAGAFGLNRHEPQGRRKPHP